jgi:hypothetical protein
VGDFKWGNIAGVVGKVAPILGTVLGGPVGAAAGGVVSAVCSLFDVDPEDPAAPGKLEAAIKADPEAALKLRQFQLENQTELVRLAMKQDEMYLQHEAEVQQTWREEVRSGDEYVRRTRPTLLRRHFAFVVAHTFAMLILYGVLMWKYSKEIADFFNGVSAELWNMYKANMGAFAVNFGGYTAVRSIWDKRGKNAPGPIEKVAGALWGKRLGTS